MKKDKYIAPAIEDLITYGACSPGSADAPISCSPGNNPFAPVCTVGGVCNGGYNASQGCPAGSSPAPQPCGPGTSAYGGCNIGTSGYGCFPGSNY